jgi:hypothetical protein
MCLKNVFNILVISVICFSGSVYGQDTIQMLSGRKLTVSGLKFEDPKLAYDGYFTEKSVKKLKAGEIEYYRVFSVLTSDGKESILYRQDTAEGMFRDETEMRYYVYGGQHAYEQYNPNWALFTAGGASLLISVFDTYNPKEYTNANGSITEKGFFRGNPTILQVITPFVLTAAIGLPKVRLRLTNVSDKALVNDENFLIGYARVAKQRKIFAALKGSLAGIAVGLVSYYAVSGGN